MIKKTVQKLNLSVVDYILIPINQTDVHWTLVSLSCKEKALRFYDILGGEGGEILKLIANLFSKITNTRYNEWQIEIMKNIPRQNNSYDCEVFVCQYAYCISKGVAFNFKQNDMINMRQIMKEELATGKLRDRLLVVPSVPSPQMALFDPSPILALPPIPDLLPATLLLPPSPIPALPLATFSPPPTPIPVVAKYSPSSSNYCPAESYVPASKKRKLVNDKGHFKYDYRLTNTGAHYVESLCEKVRFLQQHTRRFQVKLLESNGNLKQYKKDMADLD